MTVVLLNSIDVIFIAFILSQDFFGKPAFLTVSGQLNAETYATALSDVYVSFMLSSVF
jgi:aspartyl/asparaginyl-tRNA synthetase